MTLEAQLATILAPTCVGHVFNIAAPDGEKGDHVVYTRATSFPVVDLAGEAPIENARFQIDCYSPTAAGCSALASSVRAAMAAAALQNRRVGEFSMLEDGVKLFRRCIDFSVWG